MKNIAKINMILALSVFVFTGCGLLGDKSVPKEQMNSDIANKTIKVKTLAGESDWNFKDDFIRCFAPTPNESKITESNAEMVLDVSATKYPTASGYSEVMFGKILLQYKKNGDKWTLESVESKNVSSNILEGEKSIEFAQLSSSLCSYFKHSNRDVEK